MQKIKRRLCAILCAAMLAVALVPTASAATFTDVLGHWAASYIETCADLGIVSGVGNGRFAPENSVTNAEFVKMLCEAFYSSEEQTFENENRATINAYFGGSLPWYGARSYYFKELGLLNGVDYDIQTANSANRSMTRNNMAQVSANVLTQKGITASEADLTAAQAAMPDYGTIPEVSRQAVKTCYALGIINGIDGGKFDGAATMTRAQACTVITRLLDAIDVAKADKPAPSPPPSTPVDPTPEYKDIEVTTSTMSMGTAYHITDNGFGTGRLNNGKEINEANILELLNKAKEIWPTGMAWAEQGAVSNNNWYANTSTMMRNIGCGNFACGGFTAMLSDYVYGRSANPIRKVNNFEEIRVGDIIVLPNHVMIVTGINRTGQFAGSVFVAEGNRGKVVSWPDETDEWNSVDHDTFASYGSYTVYTRWPD